MQSQDRCTRGQQFAGQLFFFLQPKSTAPARRTRRSRSRRQPYHLNAVKHWSARPRVCAPLTRRSARRPCFRPHCETASVIRQFVANETKKPLFSSSPWHLLQPRAKQSLCCQTNVAKPDEVRNAFVQRWLPHELCILLSMSWQSRSSSCVTIRCCSCHAFGVDHSKPRIHLEGLMPETQIAPNATATNHPRDPAILVPLALN